MGALTQSHFATENKQHFTHCGECDALVTVPQHLNKQQRALCPRCQHTLATGNHWDLRRCAIIALSILILMPFALTFPLLSIDLLGVSVQASVWGGVWKMATEHYPYTAFLVFICAVVMPLFFALLVIMLRLAQLLKIKPRNLLLTINHIKPWVMLDVYLVSLGVAAFKVREYASLEMDIYLIAFVFMALLTTLLFIKIDTKALWNDFYPQQPQLEEICLKKPPHFCHHCEYSFNQPSFDRKKREICPRCHQSTVMDKNLILQGTWATLIAGLIMLIPANLLPISTVYLNGAPSSDTLMSGVISFIDMGSYFVAFVVFTASIFVPIGKIIILLYLLCSVHFEWTHSIKWQMRLLHIVHFVGRWSMLDLFVLSLMMSLVSRGQIISFSVGPAALYFGIAVFLTMISTSLFDSRLLWKIYDKQTHRKK
ncbi:paraquat-inducible protein A [Volucribacter psittacicida]|uniref:Paraquat-inducible protein A n=1 Tax=Volucribacter psittacicida TaxID=203482 RepID=A0A4R1G565_9PAST|nr:paraquat-inducible protein A [Volucribacter psittacicida]TCK01555.1 paraquat-inducible protein A [Volucribacter psittacicida]